MIYDVAVIGAGPAGLQTAIGAAAEGLSVALFAPHIGGAIRNSPRVENVAGHAHGFSGRVFAAECQTQLERFGVQVLPRTVDRIEPGDSETLHSVVAHTWSYRADEPHPHATQVDIVVSAHAVVIAGGCDYVVDEIDLTKDTVIGGGNSAGQFALHIAECTSRAVRLYARSGLKRMSEYLRRRLPAAQIEVVLDESDSPKAIRCIGGQPSRQWEDVVAYDDDGIVAPDCVTSVPGIFAVGDIRSGAVRRFGAATGDGMRVQPALWEYIHNSKGVCPEGGPCEV